MRIVLFLFIIFHSIHHVVGSCTCTSNYCQCPGGQYVYGWGSSRHCRSCGYGTYKSGCNTRTYCSSCPRGKYSIGDVAECTDCVGRKEPQSIGRTGAVTSRADNCVDKSANEQCEYKYNDYDCIAVGEECEDGQGYSYWGCEDCNTGTYATSRWSTVKKYSDNGNSFDTVPTCTFCPSGKTTGTGKNLLSDCYVPTCNEGEYKTDNGCVSCSSGTYQDENEHQLTTCKNCAANKQTQTTAVFGTYVSEGATHCVNCPTGYGSTTGGQCTQCAVGSDYGNTAGEGCKTYTQKYLDVDTKPTVSQIKTRAQNNYWKSLSSTRKKRQGFRAMMRWIRTQFTSRKAKLRKDDLILSTAFKNKLGTRADVEVFHPKNDENECDVNVNEQTESFDITLTEVNEIGVVCKGSIKISKLKLDTIGDTSNTYTYYCHDGSGWGNGVSISSGEDYSCDGRKFHVN